MRKYFPLLLLLLGASCSDNNKSAFRDNVEIIVTTYEDSTGVKANAMPALKPESEFIPYKLRFEYLLMNISAMHQPANTKERMEIWGLYPDTVKLKSSYFEKFTEDSLLVSYFEQTANAILDSNSERTAYSVDELMDVASKFFYCDEVLPDTNVQTHICISLNGVKEANWSKDYTLLQAFCFEAIFTDLDKESSALWDSCGAIKQQSIQKHRMEITSLDDFLQKVRLDVFAGMKNDENLKNVLLAHYESNKANLAFTIED